jgi:hypothetical protein
LPFQTFQCSIQDSRGQTVQGSSRACNCPAFPDPCDPTPPPPQLLGVRLQRVWSQRGLHVPAGLRGRHRQHVPSGHAVHRD